MFKSKNRKLVEKTVKALATKENQHMLPSAFDEISAENILLFIEKNAHITNISEQLPLGVYITFGFYLSGKIYSVSVALTNGDCVFQEVQISNESPDMNDIFQLKEIGDKNHEKALRIIKNN